MKYMLDTTSAISAVRLHFGVDGIQKADVCFQRSGSISRVTLNGVETVKGMPYFNHLRCLVMDAMDKAGMDYHVN